MAELEVLYAVDDTVATITLNTPDRLNALSEAMLRGLAAAAPQAQDDPAVRVVIVTGAGRAFCAGGDVKHVADLRRTEDHREGLAALREKREPRFRGQ
jgi:enoyl-CoA hydratase/carnithine racemase